MSRAALPPPSRDKLLFTPGPLTTSLTVKREMLHDAGSWHYEFNERVGWIRDQVLEVAGLTRGSGWECVLLQGSGTYGVEATFATCVPPEGKVLVLTNGAYGERMVLMLRHARIDHEVQRVPEDTPTDAAAVDDFLDRHPEVTHVAAVHCETTTGILNPIQHIAPVVKRHKRSLIVDAMSSFGAVVIDIERLGIDWLISSPNKCLEGVPGFSFVLGRREAFLSADGWARSLSLDLAAQLKGFEKNGQFRFTPPTHTLLAFEQALREFEAEGGVRARGERYQQNHGILMDGMQRLGFRPFLKPEVQSYIITSFHFPKSPNFTFDAFYRGLSQRGFIIYPGKISQVDLFRIGSIGRVFEADIEGLLGAIESTLKEMRIPVPLRD